MAPRLMPSSSPAVMARRRPGLIGGVSPISPGYHRRSARTSAGQHASPQNALDKSLIRAYKCTIHRGDPSHFSFLT
jgi:hypothetical protein